MAQSDNQLIRDIVKGNEAAMELLVKRHYTMVHSFVYRMVGEYEIAYDLTQEIFIKMMKNIERYDNRSGEFSRWILRIASNHCKDYCGISLILGTIYVYLKNGSGPDP